MADNPQHTVSGREQLVLSLYTFAKWLPLALLIGGLVGLISVAFSHCLHWAGDLRESYAWIPFFLPLGGVLILLLYRLGGYRDKGTNLVLNTIRAKDFLPARVAPLIFASTVITQAVGGSAGKEGAALQLGGSLGGQLGKLFRLDDADRRVAVMCGMSAAFSALFGTPMAAAVFPMEVASVGLFYYSALLPCAVSSLFASWVAGQLGVCGESFVITEPLAFDLFGGGLVLLTAVLCAAVSILFCQVMEGTGHLMDRWLNNACLRAALAGCLVLGINLLEGSGGFYGAGIPMIEQALAGETPWYAFLLKILLTAITLKGGFKGGEIVPAFVIGATFGSLLGGLLGVSPSALGAVAMVAVFCGVTNCPLASLLVGFELFDFACAPLMLLSVAVSYLLSGYYGLYHGAQTIVYSKYKTRLENRIVQ